MRIKDWSSDVCSSDLVAGETWRGSGVQHSFAPDILGSGPIMRVVSRLLQRQHRRKAGVGTFEQGAPIVAAARRENPGQNGRIRRPARRVVLAFEQRRRRADAFEKLAVERLLNRANRDVAAVSATIATVEGSRPAEQILLALKRDCARWEQSREE